VQISERDLAEVFEAHRARQAAYEAMTQEEREAAEAKEEAEYWREREANGSGLDVGSRFSLRDAFAAVMQRRYQPAPEETSGALTGQLVPSLAGPQEDQPAANSEPLPPRRRASSGERAPPVKDRLAWCRDFDQQSAEASGRFFEPGAV
jgi:hypothetical protein